MADDQMAGPARGPDIDRSQQLLEPDQYRAVGFMSTKAKPILDRADLPELETERLPVGVAAVEGQTPVRPQDGRVVTASRRGKGPGQQEIGLCRGVEAVVEVHHEDRGVSSRLGRPGRIPVGHQAAERVDRRPAGRAGDGDRGRRGLLEDHYPEAPKPHQRKQKGGGGGCFHVIPLSSAGSAAILWLSSPLVNILPWRPG